MFARIFRTLSTGSLLAIGLSLSAGCQSRGPMDALQANLRHQESLLRRYERDLSSLQDQLIVSQREAAILRKRLIGNGGNETEEATQKLAAVEGIRFNSLFTSGYDEDRMPGDERLHALLYPHDSQGEYVKLAGFLELEAVDLSLPEENRVLGRWSFSPEETRTLWHSGFLASGYQINVPWERPPQGKTVVLHARLSTTDERHFDATHSVTLQPLPAASLPAASLPAASLPAASLPAGATDPEKGLGTPSDEAISPVKSAEAKRTLPADEEPSSKPKGENSAVSVEDPRPVEQPIEQERLVPRPEPLGTAEPAKSSASKPVIDEVPAVLRLFEVEPRELPEARPFPPGLKTSDSWTDETIPARR